MQICQIKTIRELIVGWWRWLTGQKPLYLVCYWNNDFLLVHSFAGKPDIDGMWRELCKTLEEDAELEDRLDWDDVLIALRHGNTDMMKLCGVRVTMLESKEFYGTIS
jgi:hypothetical protein